jgi:hypothetical protein
MKTRYTARLVTRFSLAPCLFLLALLAACATRPAENAPDRLDVVIREISDYLNRRLPEGGKLVFLNIYSEYPALSDYIIEGLVENTVNDGLFTVVDRQNLALIRQEMDFQLSGEVGDETAQEIGKMLGAQTIVSGSVISLADVFRLRVRAIGVETAHIQGQLSLDIPAGPRIAALTQAPAAPKPQTPRAAQSGGTNQRAASGPSVQGGEAPSGGLAMIPALEKRRHFVLRDVLKSGAIAKTRDETFSPFSMSMTTVPFEFWLEVRDWATERGYTFTREGRMNKDGEVYDIDTQNAMVWCNAYSEYLGLPFHYVDDNGRPLKNANFHKSLTDTIASASGFWDRVRKLNNNGFRLPAFYEAELIHTNLHIADMNGALVEPVIAGYSTANIYLSNAFSWSEVRVSASVKGFRIVRSEK